MENEPSGVIVKTFEVLEVFLKQPETEIGISQLATLTGLKVSTVHRIASILISKGYLRQLENRGKYCLGLKFLEFDNALHRKLKIGDIALPLLEKLRTATGESANLALLGQNDVVYIEHVNSNQTLRTFTQVGNRAPLYCTGVGKILLAYMEDKDRRSMKEPFPRLTDNTITNSEELEKELAAVRREGVAVDNGEMDIGVRCVAGAVKNSRGKVIAAISISGPFTRLNSKRVEELKPLVKGVGLELSRAIGYSGE
jgi:IclR family transcriptional regulator, KDG regulon repressor